MLTILLNLNKYFLNKMAYASKTKEIKSNEQVGLKIAFLHKNNFQ